METMLLLARFERRVYDSVSDSCSRTIDFSVSSRVALISSLPVNSAYNVQWAGMLCLPPRKDQYYLYLNKQTDEERVKLWVDNYLLIGV